MICLDRPIRTVPDAELCAGARPRDDPILPPSLYEPVHVDVNPLGVLLTSPIDKLSGLLFPKRKNAHFRLEGHERQLQAPEGGVGSRPGTATGPHTPEATGPLFSERLVVLPDLILDLSLLLGDGEGPQGIGMVTHGLLRWEEALGNLSFVDRIKIAAAAPHDEKRRQSYDEHGKEAPPR